MDRKGFLKSTMIATGSLLLGGAGICRFLNDKDHRWSVSPDNRKNTLWKYEKGTCYNERGDKTR